MNLTILTPEEKKIMHIAWIEINTSAGNFVIQPNHAPTIFSISPHQPITICLTNGKQETFTKPGGILEVQRDSVLLLVDQ
jgi:F0F1-type ATP synthase epsilon subunit